MVRKQDWGRRYSDNQAYPKFDADKSELPRGLTAVPGTRRRLRPPLPTFGVSHEGNVEAVQTIIDELWAQTTPEEDADARHQLTEAVDELMNNRIVAVAAAKKNRGLTKRDIEAMEDMDVAIEHIMTLALDAGVISSNYYLNYTRAMLGTRTEPLGGVERYYAFGDAAMDYGHIDPRTDVEYTDLSFREKAYTPPRQEPLRKGKAVRRLEKEASLLRVHDDYTMGARYPPEDFRDRREDMDAPLVWSTREAAKEDVDTWFAEGYAEDYTKDDINIVQGRGLGDMGRWRYGWIVVKRVTKKPRRTHRRPER